MFRYIKQTLFILIISLFILNVAFAITSKSTSFISANAKNTTSAFTLSNKVYLCEQNVFKIIDVTDKSNIFLLSAIHLPFSSGVNLAVSGNYAYVIGPSGFAVINVSDSNNPYVQGFTPIPGDCYDIALSGNDAYVTSNHTTLNGLLNIVNITDPNNPTVASSNTVANVAHGIAYYNYHVFIADNDVTSHSLIIMNVSIPAFPYLVFSYPMDGRPSGVEISTYGADVYAHITNGTGLRIIDVTNPSSPSPYGSVDGFTQPGDIVFNNNYDYITDGEAGIKVVNVSIISTPVIANSLALFGNASRINFRSSYLYVASKYGGLRIVNATSSPTIFEEAKYIFSLVGTEDIATRGSYIYTVNQEGLNIFDASDSKNIIGVGYLPINSDKLWGIALNLTGDVALITGNSGMLRKINISNPKNPTLIDSNSDGTSLRRIVVQDPYAFVADYNFGLRIYDITPTTPVLFRSLALAGNPFAIKLSGTHLYIACGSGGMRVIDISDPSAPSEVGQYTSTNPVEDLDIAGNYTYLALQIGGMHIVDIVDPASPQLVRSYTNFDNPDTVNRIAVIGQNAYVGNKILNITNPNGILQIGILPSIYYITSYAFIDPYLYVGNTPLEIDEDIIQTFNTELPIGPEVKYAFYIDENKNGIVDEGDKAVLKFDQEITAGSLAQSNLYLPNPGDNLGSTGFNGYENTDYPTEVILELGSGTNLNVDGDNSSMDVDEGVTNTILDAKRTQLTVTDSGGRRQNDSGIDLKYVFIPESDKIIGQSGGSIGVQNSTNAVYKNHNLYIPPDSLATNHTFSVTTPTNHLKNFSSVRFISTPEEVNFDPANSAVLTLEYLTESINYDAGYINKCMKIHQIVENPVGVYNFVLVPGIQTIDTINHTISVNLSTINPGESMNNGAFGSLPIILVDENSINIKQSSGKPMAEDNPILQPKQDGNSLYKKHKIEFPGFDYDTDFNVKIRQAELLERTGFPDQSGAIFTIVSSPTNFPSASVNITVQYIPSSDPEETDVVTLNGELGLESSMKVVKRNATTGEFEFLSGTHSVDTVNHTVTINNVSNFLDSGYGTFGTVAEYTTFTQVWKLY